MNEQVELRELSGLTGAEWDRTTAAYSDATVFHRSCWHDCLQDSLPGRMVHFDVVSDGEVCGHWCGFLVRKFGASVLGAPLPGTGTDYMYPLFSRPPPVSAFLGAVRTWARAQRISMVELGGEYFAEAELSASGFDTHPAKTFRVDLTGGADHVWKHLKQGMRNKVRRAEKSKVVITHDTSADFPGRFSDMLRATFRRKGLTPTYGPKRIEMVVRTLAETNRVLPLMAYKDDAPVAALVVLVDGGTGYAWGAASYESAYPVGANDMIHWRALQLLIERGVRVYDTCGGGQYKTKFGGSQISIPSGHLCLTPMFGAIRALVRSAYRVQRIVVGQARRLVTRLS